MIEKVIKNLKVWDVYSYLNKIAPFDSQDKTDNAGLLIGNFEDDVRKILVCLDVTNAVADEAAEKGADLIIAHHPLMYLAIKSVMRDDPVHALIRHNLNFIAAHTNLDVAVGGITDLMLKCLGLPESDVVIEPINPDGTGFGKVTVLENPISAKELAEKCKSAFGCTFVKYVDSGKPISRIGVCSGGGGDLVELSRAMGCDAYICGDLRWDRLKYAADFGLTLIDAGHFHTEDIFCEDLVGKLKEEFPGISAEKAANSVDICKYV